MHPFNYETHRRQFGEREYYVTAQDLHKTSEQFIADLFICAELVTSRRDFREKKHNLIGWKEDAYTYFLGVLKKKHLRSARFVVLV